MKWAIILKKATASSVNIALVFVVGAPVYYFAGINWWRVSCLVLFFGYSLLLSRRCLGQMVARTYQNEPTNLPFAAAYTAGFATLLWWIWVPLDLALANGLFIQLPCLLIYGNTAHGLLTGRQTLTENEHLFECVAMRGQCPDCNKANLGHNGVYVWCKSCYSSFVAEVGFVRRVEIDPRFFKTGSVIEFGRQR